MSLKAYLKQVCDCEQDIYERKAKISKIEQTMIQVKNEIAEKKRQLKERLDNLNSNYNNKAKEYNRHANAKPQSLKGTIITILVILAITLAFHLIERHFIVNVVAANTIEQALPTLFIANLLPAAGVTFFLYLFFDCYSLRRILIAFLISLIALVALSSIYLQLFMNNGKSMETAIMVAMTFFLLLELIIGAIICYFTNISHKDNQRAHKLSANAAKKDMQALATSIEHHKQQMVAYDNKSKAAIQSMERDLAKEKRELAIKQEYLKKLYAQNIVHPKYQYWVAIATFYEYLDTKIRDKLEGPFGAYDLYEQELRARKITDSIDGIRTSISYQSNKLYDSQQYIKDQLSTVISHLSDISINTYGY